MKFRWIILVAAGAVVIASWAALAIAFFNRPIDPALWVGIVTAAALSAEAFLWVAAGVLGWSVLAGRKKMLAALRARFAPGPPPQPGGEA